MQVRVAPPHPLLGNFDALDRDRRESSHYYAGWLANDPRLKGRVLDVGCGEEFPSREAIRDLLEECAQLDGVDPAPGVMNHPGLAERWCATFEEAPLPAATYDALFSFWVAEHVRSPQQFMEQAFRVLKPGGAFYAFTPHALHPFALAVRLMDLLSVKRRLKPRMTRRRDAFPAYYRLNRRESVVRAARAAGFTRAEFHYIPSLQWDHYFAAPLRFLPHLYDRLVGIRYQKAAQILAFRVEK